MNILTFFLSFILAFFFCEFFFGWDCGNGGRKNKKNK